MCWSYHRWVYLVNRSIFTLHAHGGHLNNKWQGRCVPSEVCLPLPLLNWSVWLALGPAGKVSMHKGLAAFKANVTCIFSGSVIRLRIYPTYAVLQMIITSLLYRLCGCCCASASTWVTHSHSSTLQEPVSSAATDKGTDPVPALKGLRE